MRIYELARIKINPIFGIQKSTFENLRVPMQKKQANIIYTDKGDKPSRFLVNLNNFVKEEQERERTAEKKRQRRGLFGVLPDVKANIGRLFKSANTNALNRTAAAQYTLPQADIKTGAPALTGNRRHDILKQLAFYPFLRIILLLIIKAGKLFYFLCFKTGWLAVFLLRFAYFLGLAFFRLISGGVRATRFSIKEALSRFFSGYGKSSKKYVGAELESRAFEIIGSNERDIYSADRPNKTRAAEIFFHSWDAVEHTRENAKRAENTSFFRIFGRISRPRNDDSPEADENEEPVGYQDFRARFKKALKPVAVFAAVLAIAILPIKAIMYYGDLRTLRGQVMGISEDAIGGMAAAAESVLRNDFIGAEENFSYASDKFTQAESEIGEIGKLLSALSAVIPNDDIKLAANAEFMLEAGKAGAKIGMNLSSILSGWNAAGETDVKAMLDDLYAEAKEVKGLSRELLAAIARIEPEYLPAEYRGKFVELRSRAQELQKSFEELISIVEWSRIFLGFEKDARYLLVFQNNAELRGSGGFLGSYALVDLRDGALKNMQVPAGGSYDTEAGLRERIIAPEPLALVNPLWHFWDANWWPDWPVTARKLMWFYEKSDGPTVDGVIGLTPTVIERMLKITGPIDMTEEYGLVIDADNFWELTQTFSEQKPVNHPDFRPNPFMAEADAKTPAEELGRRPKKIIGDMMGKIMADSGAWLNRRTLASLAGLFEESIRQKHILLYFNDNELQGLAEDMGWDGRVKPTSRDYLQVVNTNIAGGKSDRAISETIEHEAAVGKDGSIIDTVTVRRTHNATKGERFIGVRNNDWMRIYVPEGSEFIEAEGFSAPDSEYFDKPEDSWETDPDLAAGEGRAVTDVKSGTKIYDELGKTVFANWSQVDPGETAVIRIKYRLPFVLAVPEDQGWLNKIEHYLNPGRKELVPYALFAQKQPGSAGSVFKSSLVLPDSFRPVWHYPEKTSVSSAGWEIEDVLAVDRFWAVLVEGE
ncbi:hypothetical protein A2303_04535 [Candidatus Falkowbacteria bacterium RIFOXYB2_FULL_47_14]|nr:MAG: hypothetical protein A2468_05555 [Candidatus Falkowbacteria bacterium RIFOXYC2_FULL_46_15]OGF42813.1 MAG: hypothetical protein A2303_04535 [Candidatus Falkowbacteria bacterium RIFOXYB2_FULL_47_14]